MSIVIEAAGQRTIRVNPNLIHINTALLLLILELSGLRTITANCHTLLSFNSLGHDPPAAEVIAPVSGPGGWAEMARPGPSALQVQLRSAGIQIQQLRHVRLFTTYFVS